MLDITDEDIMVKLETVRLLLEKLIKDYYGDNVKTNPALIQLLKDLRSTKR